MRKQSEQWTNTLMLFRDEEPVIRYICYASELKERLNVSDEELEVAIDRAFKACASLGISIRQNFKSVFRTCDDHLLEDWKLSPLACYLLVINADPANERVARMQIHFATKNFHDVNIF
jgi:hypothetical protein